MYALNDSVYFLPGEGFFILLDEDRCSGYFDIRGIQSLLTQALKKNTDTTKLDSALSTLSLYNNPNAIFEIYEHA